jgi:hypothetical protein
MPAHWPNIEFSEQCRQLLGVTLIRESSSDPATLEDWLTPNHRLTVPAGSCPQAILSCKFCAYTGHLNADLHIEVKYWYRNCLRNDAVAPSIFANTLEMIIYSPTPCNS